MAKFAVSFLGRDCPGVVSVISRLFGEENCNIEAVSQTMLLGEFAAIFVASAPEGVAMEALASKLQERLAKAGMDISVLARPAIGCEWGESVPCEPFVATVDGPDKPGLIGAISRVFATHGVNIENLRASLADAAPGHALFIFEIMVPCEVDLGRLRRELSCEAQKLDLRVSVQHRNIFEAVHRINSF